MKDCALLHWNEMVEIVFLGVALMVCSMQVPISIYGLSDVFGFELTSNMFFDKQFYELL